MWEHWKKRRMNPSFSSFEEATFFSKYDAATRNTWVIAIIQDPNAMEPKWKVRVQQNALQRELWSRYTSYINNLFYSFIILFKIPLSYCSSYCHDCNSSNKLRSPKARKEISYEEKGFHIWRRWYKVREKSTVCMLNWIITEQSGIGWNERFKHCIKLRCIVI